MKAWMLDTARVYFGNAQAVRDYRSQLRGNRPIFLWGTYLAVLIILAIAFLSQLEQGGSGRMSVTQLQGQLAIFYGMVVGMLAGMICLIAPALTASAITVERQRRSLDLLFSSPLSIRYLLVGKLVSSLRYVLMLLVLALPILAICVVMGGATAMDVLSVTLILMIHAVTLSAIGLVMSAIHGTIAASIIWTYLAVGAYLFMGAATGVTGAGAMIGRSGFAGEAPWVVTLSPFSAAYSGATYTTLWGVAVPNWILLLVFSVALTKLLILGAGSYLSHYGSAETKGLRIQSFLFVGTIFALFTYPIATMLRGPLSGSSAGPSTGPFGATSPADIFCAYIIAIAGLFLIFVVPAISCYAYDEGRRYWPNGFFKFRHVLDGTPAGAAPFLLSMLAASAIGGWGAVMFSGIGTPGLLSLSMAAWSAGLLMALWALGRAASGPRMGGLRTARSTAIGGILLLFFAPYAVFAIIAGAARDAQVMEILMDFYYLRPLIWDRMWTGWLYAIPAVALGLWFLSVSERKIRNDRPRFEAYHQPPPPGDPV